MEKETFDLHIKAGKFYGRDATCGKKIDYKSEEKATNAAAAMMKKGSKELEAYPCAWCSGWHIGRKMTEEEWQRFQNGVPENELTNWVFSLEHSYDTEKVTQKLKNFFNSDND